jgi:excinuclease ABC subunit C
MMINLKTKINMLPTTSGVYLMKDAEDKVIYIGKAVSIRKRVQSYFNKTHNNKTDWLIKDIADIECIPTSSEAEALILEASLIKEHFPKFNIDLRDDKSYPLIEITGESFPRIGVERPHQKDPKHEYYGPYVNAKLTRDALTLIRKIFHYRSCNNPMPKKECLDFHMGLCDAPCIGKITQKEYLRNIRNIALILQGKKDTLYKEIKEEMEQSVKEKRFEEAARLRDQLRAIGALYSGTKDINYYKEAEQLQRVLGLVRSPVRIEAFDISNIMGNQSVGSMVSFLNGKPDKNNYRRFLIRDVKGIDDFQMIGEVVRRRYSRLKKEGAAFPDLILIDGGKGQLSSACAELKKLEVKIPIVALAKQEEELFLPNKRISIKLASDSLALQLVQRVRNEAHRFALSYHRLLRGKNSLGEKTRTQKRIQNEIK